MAAASGVPTKIGSTRSPATSSSSNRGVAEPTSTRTALSTTSITVPA